MAERKLQTSGPGYDIPIPLSSIPPAVMRAALYWRTIHQVLYTPITILAVVLEFSNSSNYNPYKVLYTRQPQYSRKLLNTIPSTCNKREPPKTNHPRLFQTSGYPCETALVVARSRDSGMDNARREFEIMTIPMGIL